MKVKENTGIWLENTNKGIQETKIDKIDYYTNEYLPWQTKQRYKPWREVEIFKIETWSQLIVIWTNDVIVWFKPRFIQLFTQYWIYTISWVASIRNWTIKQQSTSELWLDQTAIIGFWNGNQWIVSIINNWFRIESDQAGAIVWTCYE